MCEFRHIENVIEVEALPYELRINVIEFVKTQQNLARTTAEIQFIN